MFGGGVEGTALKHARELGGQVGVLAAVGFLGGAVAGWAGSEGTDLATVVEALVSWFWPTIAAVPATLVIMVRFNARVGATGTLLPPARGALRYGFVGAAGGAASVAMWLAPSANVVALAGPDLSAWAVREATAHAVGWRALAVVLGCGVVGIAAGAIGGRIVARRPPGAVSTSTRGGTGRGE